MNVTNSSKWTCCLWCPCFKKKEPKYEKSIERVVKIFEEIKTPLPVIKEEELDIEFDAVHVKAKGD